MLDWSDQEFRGSGHGLDVRDAMMAMTVDAITMPLVVGELLVVAWSASTSDDAAISARRLASDGIDRSAQHDAQQQQQGRKAPSASKGQTKEHPAGSTTLDFTFSHSASLRQHGSA